MLNMRERDKGVDSTMHECIVSLHDVQHRARNSRKHDILFHHDQETSGHYSTGRMRLVPKDTEGGCYFDKRCSELNDS